MCGDAHGSRDFLVFSLRSGASHESGRHMMVPLSMAFCRRRSMAPDLVDEGFEFCDHDLESGQIS
jgi:hypothetical protein